MSYSEMWFYYSFLTNSLKLQQVFIKLKGIIGFPVIAHWEKFKFTKTIILFLPKKQSEQNSEFGPGGKYSVVNVSLFEVRIRMFSIPVQQEVFLKKNSTRFMVIV